MPDVTTKTHAQLVQDQAAAIQSKAAGLVDFSPGAILRAVVQAVGGVGLWLQAFVLAVLAMTRLATSKGADVDSFIADFAGPFQTGDAPLIERSGAVGASGLLAFSRLTATGTVLIPLGGAVETPDGSQRAVVILNAALPSWRADLQGYQMASGVASLQVPAQTTTFGVASNVLEGGFSVIASAMPGIDLVTNPADFGGGDDIEQDEPYKARFRGLVRSLREATPAALVSYADGLSPSANAGLVEFQDISGVPKVAFGYLVIDDGTGYPSADLVTAASQVVRDHRAAGVQIAVYPPNVVVANIAYALTLAPSDHEDADYADAEDAVRSYIDALGLGAPLNYHRLWGKIFDASATITDINGLTVNGATSSLTATASQMIKTGSVTAT